MQNKTRTILIAEDDEDDFGLLKDAVTACCPGANLIWVTDGLQLIDHLSRHPFPDLIMLDLNMPKMDGRVALRQVKSDPRSARIPVVVFTTSNSREDIEKCYDYGANTFIRKPGGYAALVDSIKTLDNYWFSIASLPQLN